MVKYNVPPTDDVAFGDYHDGGDLEVYTRKGGLIGRIPRDLANQSFSVISPSTYLRFHLANELFTLDVPTGPIKLNR
jgi:hypothetical protein